MTVQGEPGLRDRHKARTHQRIRAAAIELFTERGYDQVTVDDVAAACEVSRATVFRYFPTKEDLVVEDDQFEDLRRVFAERPTDEPVFDSLRASMASLATRYEDEFHHRQLLLGSRLLRANRSLLARALELQAGWTSTFAELIAVRSTGTTRPELRHRVLAATVMAAIEVATNEWLDHDGRPSLPDLLDDAMGMLAEGFDGL